MLVNGGPLSVDWLKAAVTASPPRVHAVVESFVLGQSAGQVVAEVLFGVTNPSGSLPFSLFPEDFVNQVALTNMSMRPGGHNPGRTYRFFAGKPLWPFGHSLSFTSFQVGHGTLSFLCLSLHAKPSATSQASSPSHLRPGRA